MRFSRSVVALRNLEIMSWTCSRFGSRWGFKWPPSFNSLFQAPQGVGQDVEPKKTAAKQMNSAAVLFFKECLVGNYTGRGERCDAIGSPDNNSLVSHRLWQLPPPLGVLNTPLGYAHELLVFPAAYHR